MKRRLPRWTVWLGAVLCVAALALAVVVQSEGYLTYLDGDKASELLLAKRQADTHSLIQMDWIYSTEVRIVQVNLLYALAFLFTSSFKWARILGNTAGLALAMTACVYLCRRLRLSWGRALSAAAMIPMTASVLYGNAVAIGGYYIAHIALFFWMAGVWVSVCSTGKRRSIATFTLLSLGAGFLSVRYVLCILCPMVVVAAMEMMLAPNEGRVLRDYGMRQGKVTAVGLIACLIGYAASEVVLPRLFLSGVGSASTFAFNPLDGEAMAHALLTAFADFLRLLGWHSEAALFSPAGIINLSIVGVLALGGMMAHRVYPALDDRDDAQRMQKRMMELAYVSIAVNLFCFVFLKGTYLDRYLIPAVIALVPATAVLLKREKNARLRGMFMLLLCVQLGGGSALLLKDTLAAEPGAQARGADMMDAMAYLEENGYTHGYGTFWNVRVMQERTQNELTFTGVVPAQTEEGAVSPVSLDMIRWLEPDGYSAMDVCEGKTFLILTQEEKREMAPWAAAIGTSPCYENDTFAIYGFASSQSFVNNALWGKMKLENAAFEDGAYHLEADARLRVPTSWREKGKYTMSLTCEGVPNGGVIQAYTGRDFHVLAETPLIEGENSLSFTLDHDDKYFMLLIRGGEIGGLTIRNLELEKE